MFWDGSRWVDEGRARPRRRKRRRLTATNVAKWIGAITVVLTAATGAVTALQGLLEAIFGLVG
jgi:hypothetical protein